MLLAQVSNSGTQYYDESVRVPRNTKGRGSRGRRVVWVVLWVIGALVLAALAFHFWPAHYRLFARAGRRSLVARCAGRIPHRRALARPGYLSLGLVLNWRARHHQTDQQRKKMAVHS